jgi:hypothetical protein
LKHPHKLTQEFVDYSERLVGGSGQKKIWTLLDSGELAKCIIEVKDKS